MGGRDPRAARALGLWTAAWLAVLLLAGLLWLGDLTVQWPVLLVPVLWALVAVRPRRGDRDRARGWEDLPAPGRTDTVERPLVRERPGRRPRRD
jgi:fatty acid desaturase